MPRNASSVRGAGRLVLTIAVLLPSAQAVPLGDQLGSTTLNVNTAATVHRIGRFQFDLPPGFRESGRSQSIYRTNVSTIPLAPSDASAYWMQRLSEIRAQRAPAGVSEVIVRSFQLLPEVPAVWYHRNSEVANLFTLEAMKPFNNHALLVSRGLEGPDQASVEKLLKILIKAYAPDAQKGFCVGFGTLVSEPGVNEQVQLALIDASRPNLEISLETHTVREPEAVDPLEDIEQDKRRFAAEDGSLKVLRHESRTAAALRGMESWLSIGTADKRETLRFSWSYPGTPGNAGAPAIMLVATAEVAYRAQLVAAWEEMTKTLRPVPFADPAPPK